MSWQMVRLGDVYSIKKGRKVEETPDFPDSIRYIQIDDLRNNDNIKFCANKTNYVVASNKDIIIAWDGANAGTCGYGISGAIGSTLALLSTDRADIDTNYAGAFLKTKFDYLREHCTGATIPHINRKSLESIKIPLPPISIQKKIADALHKISGLIEKRKEQTVVLDKLAQDMFIDMFGDPVINPMGWEIKKIGEIADIRIGPFGTSLHVEDYISGGIPLVNPQHMANGRIQPKADFSISKKKYAELSSYHLKENDIVLARRGEIGRCAVVLFEQLPLICGTGSMILRLRDGCSADYLQKVISYPSYSKFMESKATGSTMKNLNSGIVSGLSFPVPPVELQKQYASRINAIENQKLRLQTSLSVLEITFKSTVQKAFDGELFKESE